MISRDDLPPTPEWHPERHKCPFPIDACQICSAVSEAAEEYVPHTGGEN